MSEFDSPWKDALDHFLDDFLRFFFPSVYEQIDWERSYEVLDQELEKLARDGELGKRVTDKLFKVWKPDGAEAWILIHIEIQSQRDTDFPDRMFTYNYRIYDFFHRRVVSLTVLGDDSPSWRPTEFRYNEMGCEVSLRYLMVKLLDYGDDLAMLETNDNPFALIVLLHLQTLATRQNPDERCKWKIQLAKGLIDSGWKPDRIRLFFKFLDWMMDLPAVLEKLYTQTISEYEQEKKMPYVTSWERRGREEGVRLFVLQLLENRFGPLSDEAKANLNAWPQEKLTELVESPAKSLKELGLE